MLVSGGEDTNIKVWDLRTNQRTAIITFKDHTEIITCLALHQDLLASGAQDAKVKLWDLKSFKLLKSIKVGSPQSSYSISLAFDSSFNLAVGLSNRTIKYFEVDRESQVQITEVCCTTIEACLPRKMIFYDEILFVSFDDCTKLIRFENKQAICVEKIEKPIGITLDFCFSNDYQVLYLADVQQDSLIVSIYFKHIIGINIKPITVKQYTYFQSPVQEDHSK